MVFKEFKYVSHYKMKHIDPENGLFNVNLKKIEVGFSIRGLCCNCF